MIPNSNTKIPQASIVGNSASSIREEYEIEKPRKIANGAAKIIIKKLTLVIICLKKF
jgi:hypothetical protein